MWLGDQVIMRVDLIAVEGAHDLAFVQRLLSAFGFEQKRKLDNPENPSENIPSEVRELVPKTFPTNEERDIHKRSDVPAFHVKDEQCVVLISTGGDSKLVGGVSSAIVILYKTDIRPSSIGFILDADSNLPKQFDKLKTEWGEKSKDMNTRAYSIPSTCRRLYHSTFRLACSLCPKSESGSLETLL